MGALKELLFQVVTLGLAEESAEVLTQQLFRFLSEGYLRVGTSETYKRGTTRRNKRAAAGGSR